MNKKEVLKIITTIEEFYNHPWTRNFKKLDFTNNELSEVPASKEEILVSVVNTWHMFLKDYEFSIVSENLKRHILTNKYPPVIADILNSTKNESDRYVPTVEETRAIIEEQERVKQEVKNNPAVLEAKKKASEEIRRILGVRW